MPVDILSTLVEGVPSEIINTANKLKHSSSNIVGIGLKGTPSSELKKKCWMYFPEDNCPFYRVTVFSNYSPNNVPDINKYWSLMTETSESTKKNLNRTNIIEDTIQGLLNTKLIQHKDEVVSTWLYSADYGYPTPSIDRDSIMKKIIPYFDNLNIYSRGRFGGWKYEVSNQDHSMMQGVEWANRILYQIPEITYFYPNLANANYAKSE
jgi:protoporphyrinogen oxidase